VCEFDRSRDELTATWAADGIAVLSISRLLALFAVLAVVFLMLFGPALVAGWSVAGSTPLDGPIARLEHTWPVAVLGHFVRLPLFVLLAGWLAKSTSEQ
jgi:hypothetical protein